MKRTLTRKKGQKRWIIPDIHGCVETFKLLLEKIQFSHADRLFLLGDYINKGRSSKEVVDLILKLQEEKYDIHALRGNHEQMELDRHHRRAERPKVEGMDRLARRRALRKPREGSVRLMRGKEGLLLPVYYNFFNDLPYLYELNRFYLVHAGLSGEKPFEDYSTMIWTRTSDISEKLLKGKHIIHGHTPTTLTSIKTAIEERHSVIPLDNGCVYRHGEDLGNLLALNLDTFELVIQENVDSKSVPFIR